MIERAIDPGYVKIGCTAKVADDRFAYSESSCAFVPLPVRQLRHVPSVRRVERLVHNELARYRRESTTCVDNPTCGAMHSEWFQVDREHAIEVMVRWTQWMSEADPYDVDGQLRTSWVQLFHDLVFAGKLPTNAEISGYSRKQEKEQQSLLDQFTNLGLKKGTSVLRTQLELKA